MEDKDVLRKMQENKQTEKIFWLRIIRYSLSKLNYFWDTGLVFLWPVNQEELCGKGDLIIGTGSPGRWGSHRPQRYSGNHWMWHLGLWFSWQGGHWSRAGFDGLRGLFQPKCSCGYNLALNLSSFGATRGAELFACSTRRFGHSQHSVQWFTGTATLQQQRAESKGKVTNPLPARSVGSVSGAVWQLLNPWDSCFCRIDLNYLL